MTMPRTAPPNPAPTNSTPASSNTNTSQATTGLRFKISPLTTRRAQMPPQPAPEEPQNSIDHVDEGPSRSIPTTETTSKVKKGPVMHPTGTNTPRDIAAVEWCAQHAGGLRSEFNDWWKDIEMDKTSEAYLDYKQRNDKARGSASSSKKGRK
ncbi:hypothetical protein BDN72DRAFT_842320 [Pluteus cervinus]|uniref:Uncharacterized protein n=1 Tax=Pluteus cervinus TaxID=181527 RepID=A0ACD3ARZ4_9AGAR|nr:hypothetical protein BDN72DRAFT_842320 [Pluteus cervinus]